jgi:hypothetical protein
VHRHGACQCSTFGRVRRVSNRCGCWRHPHRRPGRTWSRRSERSKVVSAIGLGGTTLRRGLIVELIDGCIDEAAKLLQLTERKLSLPLEECCLRHCFRTFLLDPFEEALAAARKLDTDRFGTAVGLLDGCVGLGLRVLEQLCGIFLSGLTQRVGTVPSILEDALYLLTDRVESWHLLDAVGSLERRDSTMELSKLSDGRGELAFGLRSARRRKLHASFLVRDVAIDLLWVVAATK